MFVNSSTAVITKARSKYGKRLTEKDYNALLKCKTVASIVNYLRTHTHYSTVLSKINENEVHRGQLEVLLKQKNFYDYDSLCRYEMSSGSPFSEFIVRRFEIEQIVHFLRLMSCHKVEEYLYSLPSYFDKHTDIDLYKLSRCKTYDEFISALKKGEYQNILKNYKPDENGYIDLASAEDALNIFAHKELYDAISKRKSKKEKESLRQLCDNVNDFCNISRLLRIKKYYSMSPQSCKSHLLPYGSIHKDTIDKMCNASDTDEVYELMKDTRIGKRIEKMPIEKEEQLSIRSRYFMCKKNLYYSTNPAVVLLSYLYVSEAELKNIITIIEGVRYEMPADRIKSLLIFEF